MRAIFEGDPSESPHKNGMTVISDQNWNARARDPLGIQQFFASALQPYGAGHTTMTRIGMHKSHVELLMISYLL